MSNQLLTETSATTTRLRLPHRFIRLRTLLLIAALGATAVGTVFRLQQHLQPPPVAVVPPLPVETVTVETAAFEQRQRYVGSLQAGRRAELSARIGSEVTGIAFREGEEFEAGALLLSLDGTELSQEAARLAAALAKVEADRQFWRSQLARDRRLYAEQTISERALQESQRQVNALDAAYEETTQALAAARTRQGYTRITAPFAGRVQAVRAEVGEAVSPGRALIEIVARVPLKVVVAVPQADLPRLAPGQEAVVTVPATGDRIRVPIVRLYPALESGTRNGTLELALPDTMAARLQPGMGARVVVRTASYPAAIAVPQHAVQHRGGDAGVFVVEAGRAHWQPVVTAEWSGPAVRIAQGLDAGQRLVVTPYPALRHGDAVRLAAPGDAG